MIVDDCSAAVMFRNPVHNWVHCHIGVDRLPNIFSVPPTTMQGGVRLF